MKAGRVKSIDLASEGCSISQDKGDLNWKGVIPIQIYEEAEIN